MTMASADSVLISERHDISLLKLKQAPPKEYQPYYLGWNTNTAPSAPFHGLHHPNGGIKKVAIGTRSLSIGSFDDPKYNMEPNSFWVINEWDTGSTEGGSSGSPLLDRDKRIVGTLTGGVSQCSSPRGPPDIYASLYRFWNVQGSLNNPNPISYYLDPVNSQATQMDGYNPNANSPLTRSHNFIDDEKKYCSPIFSPSLCLLQTTHTGTVSLQKSFLQKPIPGSKVCLYHLRQQTNPEHEHSYKGLLRRKRP